MFLVSGAIKALVGSMAAPPFTGRHLPICIVLCGANREPGLLRISQQSPPPLKEGASPAVAPGEELLESAMQVWESCFAGTVASGGLAQCDDQVVARAFDAMSALHDRWEQEAVQQWAGIYPVAELHLGGRLQVM